MIGTILAFALRATGLPSAAMLIWAVLAPLVTFGGGYVMGRLDSSHIAEVDQLKKANATLWKELHAREKEEAEAAKAQAQAEHDNDAVEMEPPVEADGKPSGVLGAGVLRQLRRIR